MGVGKVINVHTLMSWRDERGVKIVCWTRVKNERQKDMYENPPSSIADLLSRYQTTIHEEEDEDNVDVDNDDWLS